MITCDSARKALLDSRKLNIEKGIRELLTTLDMNITYAVKQGEVFCTMYKDVEGPAKIVARKVADILRSNGFVVRYNIKEGCYCNFAIYFVEPTMKNKLYSLLHFWLGVNSECLFA